MPRFDYIALDTDGRRRSGGLEAANENAARRDLQKRALLPVQVTPADAARAPAQKGARKGPRETRALDHKTRLLATRQLATLVEAAAPLDESLGMIAAQQDRAAARAVLRDVQGGVVEGMRLADALARHPKSFPPLYRAAVAGGERAGKLGFALTRLADYLQRVEELRSKVTTALVYPAALSLIALTVITALMIFVVPTLTEQFESFDAELPLLTQVLIGTSQLLVHFWWAIALALAGAAWFAHASLKRESVRWALDAMALRAPVIGKWVRAVGASRFARALSTLIASGLPVLDSVRMARESMGNRALMKAAAEMGDRIEEGVPLSQAMRASGVIPPMIVTMAASGEGAGDLSGMLGRAADQIDQEFEAFTDSAISLLEPGLIVVMGGVVASIVLAIMLPILQLNRLAVGG